MMARRARMLALLQLSSLVLLLVAELAHAAPVSNSSSINTIHNDGDGIFLEKHDDAAHAVAPSEDKPGESDAESGHHATTIQSVIGVTKGDVDINEDVMVTKDIDEATSAEESKKDVDSMLTKSEEVSGENSDKNKDFSTETDDDAGTVDDSPSESEVNEDKHKDSPVTKSGENDKTTESNNAAFEERAGKHEDHISAENEEVTNAKGTNDVVSQESNENEEPMPTKTEENASDAESKESVEKVDGPNVKDVSTPEDSEEDLEENMDEHEGKAKEGGPSKVQLGDVSNEDSEELADAFKGKNDAVQSSSDRGSEEKKEDETAEEAALKRDNASEDEEEISEESNNEMKGKHDSVLDNSSEETSDVENEAGEIEVNENHSSTHEESHITSSPLGRLSLPSSDNHHIEENEQQGDKDGAMEGLESSPSGEETAEKETGSPDELIENDKVDSEVIKSDNKTAALGKNMPITKAEEVALKKNESLQDISKETPVALGGTLLEEINEKDNFLDNSDMDSKAHSPPSAENVLVITEEPFNSVHTTEDPSEEEEGSGMGPDMIRFAANSHKDMSQTSSQENDETESRDSKESNEDEVGIEKEDTKLFKESEHHTDGFVYSGSGDEEEDHGPFGKQASNITEVVEHGVESESRTLPEHYDDMTSEEHTTKSVPVVGDNEESSTQHPSVSPAPENENSTKIANLEQANYLNGNDDHSKEENVAQNNTNVQVMSLNATPDPDESDDHHVTFDGSGDDDTTTPVAIIIHGDIIDDSMEVPSKEMVLVNSSVIGEASPAYQEKPAEKVIVPQLAGAPPAPTTEPPCIADEEHDCLLQSNKTAENAGVSNILEDDDEVPPEPTKGVIHTKSTSDDDLKELEAVISTTTPAVKVSSEEEFVQQSISVDLNQPPLHSNEEISSTTSAPEMREITEPIVDNETVTIIAPDTIIEHPNDESGIKEKSGKIRTANVNEVGVSGQEEDLDEPEALDSSSASGSYVVLGCIVAVVVVLLAYAVIKSRRERGTNTNSKKQSEIAGDDDDGTELKDMKKALLPPETPHDDRNGDIEANRKPLMNKDEHQEEDEKEPIIKQNGTLELSEPPRDIESQVDSSTAENQLKTTPNKPQQRNGLSEVIVEKPAISNGKADSIITHPVAAKVKVIENEDSIAKTPVIINRGGNSPPH